MSNITAKMNLVFCKKRSLFLFVLGTLYITGDICFVSISQHDGTYCM